MTKTITFISQKPGVQVLKQVANADLVDLAPILGQPAVKSQIADFPITADTNQLQLGRFEMQTGEGFDFTYDFLEVKTVISGKFVIIDDQGVRYEAYPGDVLVFTPTTNVHFSGESNGIATYIAHRAPEANFLK